MTRKQVLVVAILAVVDLLVIAGLGIHAWTHREPVTQEPSTIESPATLSDCALFLLDSAERAGWTARVSDTGSELLFTVSFGPSSSPAADPEAIWTILDSLSPEYVQRCGTAETVTITAVAGPNNGDGVQQQATAQFAGESLVRWLQGLTSSSDLASQSRYRSSATESR